MNQHFEDEARTVLRCGVLIDGTGAPARTDIAVVLNGTRLGTVTPWQERNARVSDRVVDYSGATLVPGLLDAHTHLCFGSPQSQAWARWAGDPAGIVAFGLASCSAALAAGVTTVVDCGSPRGLAMTVRDLIRTGVAAGPRVLACAEAITTTAGHAEELSLGADSTDEIVKAVRGLVARDADAIKIMATGGAIDPHTNRRAAQYTIDQLRAAADDAHRLGRLVVAHANATEGIVWSVQAGIDVIAHCNWLGKDAGTIVLDLHTIAEMARRRTYVDLNLQGARRSLAETDGTPINWPDGSPIPACRWDLLAPLRKAGIDVYLTSDAFGPAIGSFPTHLGEAAVEWGLSAEELIHRVTELPARAFRLVDRGVVAPDRIADLAVFQGDLRSEPRGLGRLLAVYRDGSLVVEAGRISLPGVSVGHGVEAQAQSRLIAEAFSRLN